MIIALSRLLEGDAARPALFLGQLVDPVCLRGVEDICLEGDLAYLPCREGHRLTICSIKDPAHPKVISTFIHADVPSSGGLAGLAINGDIFYVVSQVDHSLLVIDAKDKTNLRLLGSVVIGGKGWPYKVAYREGYCFVAHYNDKKLYAVDVRNPRRPVVVGSVAVTAEDDGPFNVLLRGHYALVGTIYGRRNRLAVIDVANPAEPRVVNQVFGAAVGQVSGEFVGDLCFSVHWNTNAFLVFDVADPANPKLVAKLVDERLGMPNRCAVVGDRAYLPMVHGDGVAVVDISDPMRPRFLTSISDPVLKKTYGIAVSGDLLFIGAREGNSLVVLDRRALEK